MPEILEEVFLPGKHSIVVSGTHGKTTTTAMLAWIFHTAGKRPNFLVGGVAENFGKSYGLGGGPEFILEGDEYETAFWDRGPKFFHYHPDDLIVTSLEYDHADIYPDFETYELAFRRLVNLVPRRGRVVLWGDTAESGPALQRAAEKAFCPVETYGFGAESDWVASALAIEDGTMRFKVTHRGKSFGNFALTANGRQGRNRGSIDRRRFRPPSHGGESDDRRRAGALARTASLGDSRAALEFHAAQGFPGSSAEGACAQRPRDPRRCFSSAAIGRRESPGSGNRCGQCSRARQRCPRISKLGCHSRVSRCASPSRRPASHYVQRQL